MTHYAPVTGKVDQSRDGSGPLNSTDWAETVDPIADTDLVTVFELGDLVELETPVENDRHGVRGAWYCSLAALREADRLSALSGGG